MKISKKIKKGINTPKAVNKIAVVSLKDIALSELKYTVKSLYNMVPKYAAYIAKYNVAAIRLLLIIKMILGIVKNNIAISILELSG